MKEVFFNNLTCCKLQSDAYNVKSIVGEYACVVAQAVHLGYKKVRYEKGLDEIALSDTDSLKSYCSKHFRDPKVQFILTTARHPYIAEEEEEKQERFIMGEYYLLSADKTYDDFCFSAAFLYDSYLIGFNIADEWKRLLYSFHATINGESTQQDLFCVVQKEQFLDERLVLWLDNHDVIDETSIPKCELLSKPINLRDDHGRDILKALANKIVKSPYVKGVVNSLPFNPKAKQYIHRVGEDGLVEIVLVKTDQGLGMVVKTTGRNYKETLWIAKELVRKYF